MAEQYKIRRARASDLDRILEIETASFGREAYDRKLFAHYMDKCGELFLVAARRRAREGKAQPREKLCGYLIVCLRGGRPGGSAELVSVAVESAARGKGAASALLESALRRLARRDAGRLNLVVRATNDPALAFYEKYGFRRLRIVPAYYEDGGDGIAMWRPVRLPRAPARLGATSP
jgi:ribosomal-protein-alanine N-acetyltransferase